MKEYETPMTDKEIETQRIAGDITLVLLHGTEEQKQSLLRAIEQASGLEERQRLEALVAGMEGS